MRRWLGRVLRIAVGCLWERRIMNAEVLEVATKAVQLYAESHPRPLQVNISQAADMLGISRKTLSGRIKSGWIRMNALGMIPIGEIDRVITPHKDHT
jgi:hypothetical protein